MKSQITNAGKSTSPITGSANTESAVTSSPTSDKVQMFTLDELAKHNTAQDCYIAYGGQVFNITWFIPRHEGGNEITQMCGTVTDDFSKIHEGGPFTKGAIQAVLQMSVVGNLGQ